MTNMMKFGSINIIINTLTYSVMKSQTNIILNLNCDFILKNKNALIYLEIGSQIFKLLYG